MLTAVDLDDELPFKADEVENVVLKGDLPSKFVFCEASIAEQTPHRQFGVGGLVAHFLRETAEALGDRSMAWWLQREPLTRRLTS